MEGINEWGKGRKEYRGNGRRMRELDSLWNIVWEIWFVFFKFFYLINVYVGIIIYRIFYVFLGGVGY